MENNIKDVIVRILENGQMSVKDQEHINHLSTLGHITYADNTAVLELTKLLKAGLVKVID